MIKFIRAYGPYGKDDTAVFSERKEGQLIKERFAMAHDPNAKPAPKPDPKSKDNAVPATVTRQTTVGPQRRG